MSGLGLALRQIRFENKAFWRNPPAAFFTFAFPLIFLVLFTLLFGSGTTRIPGVGEIALTTFYVTSILAFSVINACYTNLAMGVPFARDEGVLKRVRGTPLPAWSFLVGKIGHSVLMMLLLIVIVIAFGAIFYDAALPTGNTAGLLATLIIGSAAFCALGLATTAFIPNAEAAPAIVNAVVLPLLFISDIFIPLDQAPDWLGYVAELFPVKHFADATRAAYIEAGTDAFDPADLVWVAAWGLIGLLVAMRFFSWEPRR
jgi:ABC-2 type transport system permease protein